MKQKVIGNFYMGYTQYQLVLREGTDGEFYLCPGDGEIPRIKIGADYKTWQEVVTVLLHEAYEACLSVNKCRMQVTEDLSNDHSGYVFLMTHVQFSDCCARVSEFITEALPKLATEWKRFKKKKV